MFHVAPTAYDRSTKYDRSFSFVKMDPRLDDHLKCRICLSPDATADFIQLKGSKAEMFEEVIGVKLMIDGVKSESVMCQTCFSELERFHNFRARGVRADREYFEIQRQRSASQQEPNEPAHATNEAEPREAETAANEPQSPVTGSTSSLD